jgi:hypothetical protein
MDAIRAFYATMDAKGLVAEHVGPIRLRDEDPAAGETPPRG